jgi:hypothetical protein
MSLGLKSLRTQIWERKIWKTPKKIPKFGKALISGFKLRPYKF